MAEDNFTLATFYTSWQAYQEQIKGALAPLTAEQLALRAAPGLRSVGENAIHIIGCRAYWFTEFLGEASGEEMAVYRRWNGAAVSGSPVTLAPTATELAQGLDDTWQFMAGRLARWSPDDMRQTFPDDWDGKPIELSRAWVVWHVLEHDLSHGGEISYALGMHGLAGVDI
ncbi:MAG TPA: DinB family protein [Ktedonobacterales bacterium]|nr:DinB family protein [Ktedonobacterales bacterium]